MRTYQTYEQDRREPDLRTLTALSEAGWNLNWVLIGKGPERISSVGMEGNAAPLDQPMLQSVIETVESALDLADAEITPRGKAQMVMAIYRHWVAHKLSPSESVALALRTIQEVVRSTTPTV